MGTQRQDPLFIIARALRDLPTADIRRRAEALARAGKINEEDIEPLVELARRQRGWEQEEPC
jgi:hypothetical protein